MRTIKDYKSWLLEKKEMHKKVSHDKPTEKDFSKSLSSNYSHVDVAKPEDLGKKHGLGSKNLKGTTPEKSTTKPKVKDEAEVKMAPKTSNPAKPEKKGLGKVGDIQVSNKSIKDNEPSKKSSVLPELEETTVKKVKTTPKEKMGTPIAKTKEPKKGDK